MLVELLDNTFGARAGSSKDKQLFGKCQGFNVGTARAVRFTNVGARRKFGTDLQVHRQMIPSPEVGSKTCSLACVYVKEPP